MSRLNVLIRRPALSFFVLSYLISWAIWTPIIVSYYRNPFPISFAETPIPLILLALLGFFGPTFSALILAAYGEGGKGVRRLLSGWRLWRVGIEWYLAIVASQIAIELLATRLYITVSHVSPEIDWTGWSSAVPTFLRAALLGGAIAEETGWRGYALPKLARTRSALSSSIVIGLAWGVWHLPISLVPGANFPVALNPLLFSVFVVNAVAISVVMTWLFNNTGGSIFVCYLYHALLNTSLFGGMFHFADTGSSWWGKMYYGTALRAVFALLLILIYGSGRLSRSVRGADQNA